jgi:tryptophanyl-tRNA synthetase
MGELERMTQYKDKGKKQGSRSSVGLFTYPILMAADILLYDTEVVPVGEDQKQHVELARDLAERFNRRYGETFKVPQPLIREQGARLMGLDDPMKKMSKSAASAKNYISLLDDDKIIEKKIKSAVTDSGDKIRFDASRPGIANLMTILSLITKKSLPQIEIDYATTKGYGDFKEDVAEALALFLKPLRVAIETHLKEQEKILTILDEGAKKANTLAEQKMEVVRERIGVHL